MSHAPRRILNLAPVRLEPGSVADITVIDADKPWTVLADGFESKSNNSAFLGCELFGKARHVFVDGYATLQDGITKGI